MARIHTPSFLHHFIPNTWSSLKPSKKTTRWSSGSAPHESHESPKTLIQRIWVSNVSTYIWIILNRLQALKGAFTIPVCKLTLASPLTTSAATGSGEKFSSSSTSYKSSGSGILWPQINTNHTYIKVAKLATRHLARAPKRSLWPRGCWKTPQLLLPGCCWGTALLQVAWWRSGTGICGECYKDTMLGTLWIIHNNYCTKKILISKPCFSHLKYWSGFSILPAGLRLVKDQVEVKIALNHFGSGFRWSCACMNSARTWHLWSTVYLRNGLELDPEIAWNFVMSSVISLCPGSRFLLVSCSVTTGKSSKNSLCKTSQAITSPNPLCDASNMIHDNW